MVAFPVMEAIMHVDTIIWRLYVAAHIHARVETNEDRRLLIESDLIAIRKQMC